MTVYRIKKTLDSYTEVMTYLDIITEECIEKEVMWGEEVRYNNLLDKYIVYISIL